MARVGFIGPGRLGEPMVVRLVGAGHEVTAFVRREDTAARLRDAGARTVGSAADAAAGAEVVVVCLFSEDQLLSLLDGADGLLAGLSSGTVVASHITGSRTGFHDVAARVAAAGGLLVDAPVSGGVAEIVDGRLTVLLGGEGPAVDAAAAVVGAYADPVVRTGPPGSALAVKLINNLLFAAHVQAAAAAVDLAGRFGLGSDVVLAALAVCSGRSFATGLLAHAGSAEAFADQIGEYLRKDVAACVSELTREDAEPGPLLTLVESGPLRLLAATGTTVTR